MLAHEAWPEAANISNETKVECIVNTASEEQMMMNCWNSDLDWENQLYIGNSKAGRITARPYSQFTYVGTS